MKNVHLVELKRVEKKNVKLVMKDIILKKIIIPLHALNALLMIVNNVTFI